MMIKGIGSPSMRQAWNYEFDRIPDLISRSDIYHFLPHNVRKILYNTLYPRSYYRIRDLRVKEPKNIESAPSLKPFLDSRSIFIHIPKAAGVSIGLSLYGRKTGDHRSIEDYKLCFNKLEFNSFFKFTFVRNPWDRLLSAYLYLKKGGRNRLDQNWSMEHLSTYNSFNDFVEGWLNPENILLGCHFKPQYAFICTQGLTPDVDFVGYFENLDQDYEYIRQKVGQGNPLMQVNRTSHKTRDYREYYNDNTKRIVAEIYYKDIQLFGYCFDGILEHPQEK